MSTGWAGGSTRVWRETRARVLFRDRYACKLKIDRTCIGTATHVHHIHGKRSDCPGCRADDETHLVAACAPCNLHIGDPMTTPDPPCIPITKWRP